MLSRIALFTSLASMTLFSCAGSSTGDGTSTVPGTSPVGGASWELSSNPATGGSSRVDSGSTSNVGGRSDTIASGASGGTSAVGGASHVGGTSAIGGASNSGGAQATGGASNSGGAKVTGGTTSVGSTSTVVVPPCPATAPTNSTPCGSTPVACFYDDCPATGRTNATCTSGMWSVETAPCGAVRCSGAFSTTGACNSGETCYVYAGGFTSINCRTNPCGVGPVTNQCAPANCSVTLSLSAGVTFYCSANCPIAGCA